MCRPRTKTHGNCTQKAKGAKDDNGMPVKFKGRLTDNSIKGGAIRNNTGSIDGMMNDIDASFLHSMSTDTYSVHTKCPKHEPPDNPSWCKFMVAKYNNEPMPKHKHPPLIPADLAKHIKPQRLAHRDLLERCTLGATQNQNESFNNTIWIHVSKTQFLGKQTVELSANLAVLLFNEGREVALKRLFSALNFEITQRATEYYKHADRLRLFKSDIKASVVEKTRRKRTSRNRATAEEIAIEVEGSTYGAGEH